VEVNQEKDIISVKTFTGDHHRFNGNWNLSIFNEGLPNDDAERSGIEVDQGTEV
jgi:hypothetical protein